MNNKKESLLLQDIDLDNKGLLQYKLRNDKKEARKTILLAILITFILTAMFVPIALHFINIDKFNFDMRINELSEKVKSLETKLPKEQAEQK